MKTEQMEQLILLLKEFKNELEISEDKRDVNMVIKMVDNTIKDKQYYSN